MEYLVSYGLAFAQLSFILLLILLLHRLKPVIGNAAFYLVLGGLTVLTQIVTAIGIKIVDIQPGFNIGIGSTVYFTPLLAALLIIYIIDGTLEAQRLILGQMVIVAFFLYVVFLTEKMIFYPGYSLQHGLQPGDMVSLFQTSRFFMMAYLLSILVMFIILPVVYQILRNNRCGMALSVFGALIFSQVLDAFVYELVTNYFAERWWDSLRHSFMSRALAMVWVSAISALYLHTRIKSIRGPLTDRHPFEIVATLFGGYDLARRLQANIRAWEGRYRMVVENTHELIFLVAENGMVLDANRTALDMSGYTIEGLLNVNVQTLMKTPESSKACDWAEIWKRLRNGDRHDNQNNEDDHTHGPVTTADWMLSTPYADDILLDASISELEVESAHAALIVARDVTRRKRLESEREHLQSQFIHSQRLEAVGRLAGGVAHDFNNLLHAIQGSLDVLEEEVDDPDKAREMIATISQATERATTLTGQLLGFARKGKYEMIKIKIANLIRQTEELFGPVVGKKISFKVAIHPDPMEVEGDFTQLQQVIFNILINAKDAIGDTEGTIALRAEPASHHTAGWKSASDMLDPKNFIVIRIRDSGGGMDDAVRKQIFEPFFTTKLKEHGTGMGLAMADGCIANHNGWIYLETEQDKGTEFFIYLPRQKTDESGST